MEVWGQAVDGAVAETEFKHSRKISNDRHVFWDFLTARLRGRLVRKCWYYVYPSSALWPWQKFDALWTRSPLDAVHWTCVNRCFKLDQFCPDLLKGAPGFESRTGGRGEGGVLKPLKKFTTWAENCSLGSQFCFGLTFRCSNAIFLFFWLIFDLYIINICFSLIFDIYQMTNQWWRLCYSFALKLVHRSEIPYCWAYSNVLMFFSTCIVSEYHLDNMFFLELPFWVWHIHFWGVGGEPLKCLKKFTDPVSFFKILGPPCLK